MELVETIEYINERLIREFGKESNAQDQPRYRLVFSDDQYEKRWTNFTNEGFELIHPEVRELPKYKQFIHQKYILERLVPVPEGSDLVSKVSYEPAWVFMDCSGKYLPPIFDACKFVIEAIQSQIDGRGKFKSILDNDSPEERKKAELAKVSEELFGDETKEGDALHHGYGVTDFNQKVELPSGENTEVSE